MDAKRTPRWSPDALVAESNDSPPPACQQPLAVPPGFTLCPQQLAMIHAWQQAIYRWAYEQALEATRLPRHHRLLFSVWN